LLRPHSPQWPRVSRQQPNSKLSCTRLIRQIIVNNRKGEASRIQTLRQLLRLPD
jgi:hypothetical protein